jgi:hypothetical protein
MNPCRQRSDVAAIRRPGFARLRVPQPRTIRHNRNRRNILLMAPELKELTVFLRHAAFSNFPLPIATRNLAREVEAFWEMASGCGHKI